MHAEMRDNWVKIGLITLTVMMFVAVFNVEAEQKEENYTDPLLCPNEAAALENINYIRKGVEIWNNSKVKNEDVLKSILNLTLGTGFQDGCLYLIDINEAQNLKNSLKEAGLNDEEMVNGLIKRLNKSGYISPLPTIVSLETY